MGKMGGGGLSKRPSFPTLRECGVRSAEWKSRGAGEQGRHETDDYTTNDYTTNDYTTTRLHD